MGKGDRIRAARGPGAHGTGVIVSLDPERLARMRVPDQVPGQHFWGIFAMWRVSPEAYLSGEVWLDTENLVTTSALACIWCERAYTESVGAAPCPGEQSE